MYGGRRRIRAINARAELGGCQAEGQLVQFRPSREEDCQPCPSSVCSSYSYTTFRIPARVHAFLHASLPVSRRFPPLRLSNPLSAPPLPPSFVLSAHHHLHPGTPLVALTSPGACPASIAPMAPSSSEYSSQRCKYLIRSARSSRIDQLRSKTVRGDHAPGVRVLPAVPSRQMVDKGRCMLALVSSGSIRA